MGNELQTSASGLAIESDLGMVQRINARIQTVQHVYRNIMKQSRKDENGNDISGDYGLIPGCGNKPSLFKAGAEKLMLAFQISPTFKVDIREYEAGHREVQVICTLTTNGGVILGEGLGSCSTMESKYRYRKSAAKAIVLDEPIPADYKEKKTDYRARGYGCKQENGVWVWVKYEGGDNERVENPDIADQYNTVLKMAKKRALVDAALTVLGASDLFTQDIEDMTPQDSQKEPQAQEKKEPQKKEQPKAEKAKELTPRERLEELKTLAKGHSDGAVKFVEKEIETYCRDVAGKAEVDLTDLELASLVDVINKKRASMRKAA